MQNLIQASPELSLLLGGLLIGFAFGVFLQRFNFCAMGAISDMVTFGDLRRFRAWMLAAAVALIGAQALDALSIIDLDRARYLAPRLNWLGHGAGGFVFGMGMVLAGGCASRNLVRAGSGDLRALLLLLVITTFAFAALSGAFGQLRFNLAQATQMDLQSHAVTSQHLGDVIGAGFGSAQPYGNRFVMALIFSVGLLGFVFASGEFRNSHRHIASGIGVGLCVVAAWALTGLAFDDFSDRPARLESLSFVAPLGDAINWFERATALGLPSFGAASVFGVLIGSFVSAKSTQTFALQTFADTNDTLRHLAGGALMGIGGVFALGCTIGQGISGLSTLAVGSLISVAAIIAGAITMLRYLMR
ncbi:MAG: YeeE/YedE family protein [Alphaproteobacteria bacterium]|nr:YeeE/YedE family protein [Alphaproteobacteria bacterium]